VQREGKKQSAKRKPAFRLAERHQRGVGTLGAPIIAISTLGTHKKEKLSSAMEQAKPETRVGFLFTSHPR
jgi:hypothetical protein